jgi:hypothetical protein
MDMNDLQRFGGISALAMAGTFIVGFIVFLGVLMPAGYFDEDVSGIEKVRILVDNQAVVSISYLTAFVIFGICLVVLSLALYERLKDGSKAMAQIATALGLIWAGLVIASGMIAVVGIRAAADLYSGNPDQAGSAWAAIEAVQLGIGGGIEIVGALWVLLLGWAAIRSGVFSRRLNYFALVVGISGSLTIVPALEIFGALFGLGLIVWFVWIGITMLGAGVENVKATGRVQTGSTPA